MKRYLVTQMRIRRMANFKFGEERTTLKFSTLAVQVNRISLMVPVSLNEVSVGNW